MIQWSFKRFDDPARPGMPLPNTQFDWYCTMFKEAYNLRHAPTRGAQ